MGVSASAVARVVGIDTAFKNLRGGRTVLLPQQVALIGQGATASSYVTTPAVVTTAAEVGTAYGFGSPVHLAAKMLLPANGDGLSDIPLTVYGLEDDGSGIASDGNIVSVGTHEGSGTYQILLNGIPSSEFTLTEGQLPAAIGPVITLALAGNIDLPMTAVDGASDDTDLTSKWKGSSANDILIEITGPSQGIAFTITQPVNGATNPDVTTATAQIVNKWETLIVNCLDHADTTALDAFSTFGEGRWGELVKKPLVVLTGYTEDTTSAGTVITDARKTDRTNAYIVALGSNALPCQVAARAGARIARQANDNPPVDYATQLLDGITPGAESLQLSYPQQDAAVKLGLSTSNNVNGNVALSDTVTFYHPDGEDPPAYRYVVDIVKVAQVIFNLDLIFTASEWAGAPLIPDDQATTNPAARKPSAAKAEVNVMIDGLALAAILSDPATAKALTVAVIDSGNPKRLNVTLTVQISGNANVISVDLNFGFFFGTAALAA